MPESPEVAKQSDKIRKYTEKCNIIFGLCWDDKSRYHTREDMKGFKYVKLPITVENVYSRGKLIIFECFNISMEKIFMVSHLGMTGFWTEKKDKHSNLWIKFGKEENGFYREIFRLYYNDARKFGSFNIYKDLGELFKKNGPCLMSASLNKYKKYQIKDAATFDIWNKSLKNTKLKNKPICEFMLEQKHVSGIGNFLRCEILYKCKIHPNKTLEKLTESEIKILYEKTLEIIYKFYSSQGIFECYGEKFDPLGNKVEKYNDSKKRTVHFVPNIQVC